MEFELTESLVGHGLQVATEAQDLTPAPGRS